jgi:hypothetical protein
MDPPASRPGINSIQSILIVLLILFLNYVIYRIPSWEQYCANIPSYELHESYVHDTSMQYISCIDSESCIIDKSKVLN